MTITSPDLAFGILATSGQLDSRLPGGAPPVTAGALYVSPTGDDAGDGSIDDPFLTPVFAAQQLAQGQTLYFRGGTYDIPSSTSSRSCAISPTQTLCTLAAYPGERVVLRGGYNGNYGVFPTGGTIGSGGREGTVIRDMTIVGMVVFDGYQGGSVPQQLINCDVSVGGDGWGGINQGGVVWIDDSRNVQIINCWLHDNDIGSQSTNAQNNALIMCYDSHDSLVAGCTFSHSAGSGITMKDDLEHMVIRNCWFDNIPCTAINTGNNAADPYDWSLKLHNCIFTRCNTSFGVDFGAIKIMTYSSQCDIYNNTFHANCAGGGGGDLTEDYGTVPFSWTNNIHYQTGDRFISFAYSSSTDTATEMDRNTYFDSAPKWVYKGTAVTTLSAWQTISGHDASSITTDPGFINASGNFSRPTDFKRAAYTPGPSGGVHGAYVTGNEIIGCTLPEAPPL